MPERGGKRASKSSDLGAAKRLRNCWLSTGVKKGPLLGKSEKIQKAEFRDPLGPGVKKLKTR